MKIAVIGAGAVGGYFGAQLVAAGEDVYFVVNTHSLSTLDSNGLTILSETRPQRLSSIKATDDPAAVGHVDIVIFTVKLPDAGATARFIAPLIGPHTIILPLQNGVEAPHILAAAVPSTHVAAGCAHIIAARQETGVILHSGSLAALRFGSLATEQLPYLKDFECRCRKAKIDARLVEHIWPVLWEKFILLVGISAVTTLNRRTIGAIRSEPPMREMLKAVMQEAFEVSCAKGIGLAADFVEKKMLDIDKLPSNMKASMLLDLEAGRRLELPWLSGAVIRLGKQHGFLTPANQAVVTGLEAYVNGSGY